jgi:transposase
VAVKPTRKPRVRAAQRNQLEMRTVDLDSTIAEDHTARMIWKFLDGMNLSKFYARIKVDEHTVGRAATDPKILLALWLYAHTDGIGSARAIDRLCRTHDAYRWICGGVEMNYHTLSDFRIDHGDALDDLLAQMLAVLMHNGVVQLARVAQDGMRVRADAGAASFRRKGTLEEHLARAREQVEKLRRELDEDPTRRSRAEEAARERAARERAAALERALAEMPAVEETKRRQKERRGKAGEKIGEARVSTTDPEARVMKMGDGGFRPAYNVQLATDADSRVIVGVRLTNEGSDLGQLIPMVDDIERCTGVVPGEYLVDGGYTASGQITEATRRGATIYAPLKRGRARRAGARPNHRDTPEVAAWRCRMVHPDAQRAYRARAATAETTNADLRRWRGLDRFQVRGLRKARCHAMLSVLAYNLARWDELMN